MKSSDGKSYMTDCANSETLFRVIQSIPSPKVEPLKRWLAKVGKERLDEIENPELAMGRMQDLGEVIVVRPHFCASKQRLAMAA